MFVCLSIVFGILVLHLLGLLLPEAPQAQPVRVRD